MKALEIFSGTGGLAKGLELAGFEHTSLIEINKHACASLRKNFNPKIVFEGDIQKFDFQSVNNIDIVAGGPPCQPFSLGGKHLSHHDHRNMFPYAIKCIQHFQPKAFLFENVKGLLRTSFLPYFTYIILCLKYPNHPINKTETWEDHLNRLQKITYSKYHCIKYNIYYKLLNSADYGIPQKRERVIIIGIRSDLERQWEFPKPIYSEDRLNWDKFITGQYWEKHDLRKNENIVMTKLLRKKYGIFPPEEYPWTTIRDALFGVPHPNDQHNIPDHIFKDGARTYPGHTGSDIDSPSKTIKAGSHGVPGGENMLRYENNSVRYFTTYEAKLLQTFPKDFQIIGNWGETMRQIGNAVPVKLSEILAKKLYNIIK